MALITPVQHHPGRPSQCAKAKKRNKWHVDCKEIHKTNSYLQTTSLSAKSLGIYRKLLELINEFSKVTIQQSVIFLYYINKAIVRKHEHLQYTKKREKEYVYI